MKKTVLALLLFSGISFTSCEDGQQVDEPGVQINTHGSININMSTQHFSDFDIIKTEKTVYDNYGSVSKIINSYDTVPSLGPVKDTLDTGRTVEDENGDTNEIDTVFTHPKDYQFYVSFKK